MTERRQRANQWRKFRRDFYFTQKRLADVLGTSIRSVQNVEHAVYTRPTAQLLGRFEILKIKCEQERKYGRESSSNTPQWSGST